MEDGLACDRGFSILNPPSSILMNSVGSRVHRLRAHGHVAQNLFDDVVGGDAFGFGFGVGDEAVAHLRSGFGFITQRHRVPLFFRLRNGRLLILPLNFAEAADLRLELFPFRFQHREETVQIVTALRRHLMADFADFLNGYVGFHISSGFLPSNSSGVTSAGVCKNK